MYYPSGTQFTQTVPSVYSPGEFLYGNDSNTLNISASGASGANLSQTITTSQVNVWYTGAVSLFIGAEDQGLTGSITPSRTKVVVMETGFPVTVSGLAGVTINGSTSPVTCSGIYTTTSFSQISGNTWITGL